MNTLSSVHNWLKKISQDSNLSYRFVPLDESKEWKCKTLRIQHKSGRFFDVVGIQWKDNEGITMTQPLIRQEEIGTLGFLLRVRKNRNEILLYAKVEPGNMGIAQIAPTCQATASNIALVHKGRPPPFTLWFSSGPYLCSTLQSEQGSRFLGKRNRNVVRLTNQSIKKSSTHRWMPVENMMKIIDTDFLVNTDARSVLVCSPWNSLIGRAPFSLNKTAFGKELYQSYHQGKEYLNLSYLKKYINTLKKRFIPPRIISLNKSTSENTFVIKHMCVSVIGREVPYWDQPIICNTREGNIDLFCGRMHGALYFLFRPQAEPGLYNGVELSPTFCNTPDNYGPSGKLPKGYKVRVKCRQSEEGGRFFKNINQYRVIDIGHIKKINRDDVWLSLSQIQKLLLKDGWFTNEARSAISLLFKWL